MTKEEQFFRNRLEDLARKAWQRQIPLFTDFLDCNELNIYQSMRRELSYVSQECFGGYAYAERQMIGFIPDALSASAPDEIHASLFPIRLLQVTLPQVGADKLSHRDYLGSLMHLGIDRGKIGDILVSERGAGILCERSMADYLSRELVRVRHTSVTARVLSLEELDAESLSPKLERISGSVASVRLDTLMALAFRMSRSAPRSLIEGGSVFVNARLVTSPGAHLKEGDLISVRGLGRFRYVEEGSRTRKDRIFVSLDKYVS